MDRLRHEAIGPWVSGARVLSLSIHWMQNTTNLDPVIRAVSVAYLPFSYSPHRNLYQAPCALVIKSEERILHSINYLGQRMHIVPPKEQFWLESGRRVDACTHAGRCGALVPCHPIDHDR